MSKSVCWVETIAAENADPSLSAVYDSVRGTDGQLDNLYQAFSLRAHTIKPADDLYLAALHNPSNTLAKDFAELIGTYVAILTDCHYARAHHGENYTHLCGDAKLAKQVLTCMETDDLDQCGDPQEVAALRYVRKLCREPEAVRHTDVKALQSAGWKDGEILEIVQIVAMFSYFVRVINGIGIELGDEKIGLY